MFAQYETRGLQLRLLFSEFFIVLNTSCTTGGRTFINNEFKKRRTLLHWINQTEKHITISERGAIMIDGDCFGSWL